MWDRTPVSRRIWLGAVCIGLVLIVAEAVNFRCKPGYFKNHSRYHHNSNTGAFPHFLGTIVRLYGKILQKLKALGEEFRGGVLSLNVSLFGRHAHKR